MGLGLAAADIEGLKQEMVEVYDFRRFKDILDRFIYMRIMGLAAGDSESDVIIGAVLRVLKDKFGDFVRSKMNMEEVRSEYRSILSQFKIDEEIMSKLMDAIEGIHSWKELG